MNAKLIRSYRNKNGNLVFVHAVSGTPAQLEAFKKAQGDFFRTSEDGTPLWFSTRCIGDSGKLIITSKGKVVADMSQFDQMASLAKQYGGDLGQALAQSAASKLLGTPAVVSAPVAETKPEDGIDKL